MKKEYSFITTYFDDIIVDDIYSNSGRYAQSVDTIRATYGRAVRYYYKTRNRLEADDARAIAPDFYIKKFYRILYRDFKYKVTMRGCTRPQYFYKLRFALLETTKHNARALFGLLRLAVKYRKIKCALELYRLERETVKFDFS